MSALEIFCSVSDLKDEFGTKEITRLSDIEATDRRETPVLNEDLVYRYIEKASEEIISKLKGSYDFPLYEKSAILNDVCVVLTMVKLQRRVHAIKQNSSLNIRYNEVKATLNKLMTGKIKLTESSSESPSLIKVTKQPFDFTKENLKALRKT